MSRFLIPLLLLLPALLCAKPAAAADKALPAPLKAVVSIPPQKYILERIAGDAVTVTVLSGPGDDPHSYEPSPSQMRAVAAADCWFTIGVPFEDIWLPRIKGAAPQLAEVSLIEGLSRLPWDEEDHAENRHGKNRGDNPAESEGENRARQGLAYKGHEHGGADPHVWLSPMLVREMTANTAKKLCRLLPDKAPEMRRRAAAFLDELEKLDADLETRFAEFPRERRVFLTVHPSWRYFAHNYGLTQLCLESGGKEPGPRSLQAVIDRARELGIRTVFVEPQFPGGSARAVAQALDAEVVEMDPLAENLPQLYTDLADKLIASFRQQGR